jgi:hypothetical protein
MTLCASVTDVCQLRLGDRDAMYQLMERSYVNMRRDRFDADLDAKRWVILVRLPDSRLIVGFSTQVMLKVHVGGVRIHALYSGDTVVDRIHWGDPALASAWGNFALQLADEYSHQPLFWFLTSKGFRTYRYLPLFFRSYYPHPEMPTSSRERALVDAFGQCVANEMYNPISQIICNPGGKDFVKPDFSEPGRRRNSDRHVQFFVDRNPGYVRGDELCCLAPLTRENFTRAAYRVIAARSHSLAEV